MEEYYQQQEKLFSTLNSKEIINKTLPPIHNSWKSFKETSHQKNILSPRSTTSTKSPHLFYVMQNKKVCDLLKQKRTGQKITIKNYININISEEKIYKAAALFVSFLTYLMKWVIRISRAIKLCFDFDLDLNSLSSLLYSMSLCNTQLPTHDFWTTYGMEGYKDIFLSYILHYFFAFVSSSFLLLFVALGSFFVVA